MPEECILYLSLLNGALLAYMTRLASGATYQSGGRQHLFEAQMQGRSKARTSDFVGHMFCVSSKSDVHA